MRQGGKRHEERKQGVQEGRMLAKGIVGRGGADRASRAGGDRDMLH